MSFSPLPMGQEKGITIDKIREKNYLRCDNDPIDRLRGRLFSERPTGRAMFYREDPKPDYMMGQELDLEKEKLSVFWEPAREADLSNPIREKYPFTICCEHMRTRAHTQWYDVDYLKEFEAAAGVPHQSGRCRRAGHRRGRHRPSLQRPRIGYHAGRPSIPVSSARRFTARAAS